MSVVKRGFTDWPEMSFGVVSTNSKKRLMTKKVEIKRAKRDCEASLLVVVLALKVGQGKEHKPVTIKVTLATTVSSPH